MESKGIIKTELIKDETIEITDLGKDAIKNHSKGYILYLFVYSY